MTWVEASIVFEQVGRFASAVPVAASLLAIDAAVQADEAAVAEMLLAGGVSALVVSTQRYPLHADPTASTWSISGDGAPALHVPIAQHVLCTAQVGEELGLFLTAVDDGVSIEPVAGVDPTRALGRTTFRRARATRLGGPEEVARLIDRASLVATADMLGGARHVVELASAYAKDRVQFGQPIGSFQAVKHRLADMLVDVEAMHSLTFWAAWCLSNEPTEARVAAAAARWCARECTPRIMAGALQVHGGIGFTWEHELRLHMKRATVNGLPIGELKPCEPDLSPLLVEAYHAGQELI